MEIREATDDDIEGIRTVARESLLASYTPALSEELIEEAVDNWYGDGFEAELADDEALLLVGVEDDTVVAFSQSYLTQLENQTGDVNWLHVHPDHRGHGYGSKLLTETEGRLVDSGIVRLKGRVLEANESGPEFYESHGYDRGDEREVEIGDGTFTEWSFVKLPGEEGEEYEAPLDPRELEDGRTVYVAYDEADRGDKGPLFVAYMDENREERYGYFCGHCESFDIAMDAMGRIECNDCENKRKPSRWDASYL
ncbi:GNAT family N-acetyltransferase [Halobium salinum]|uniref:GNAT family N-acetyltransferase n=1 Tax=Halobium salinum TaxID=1364940 RepID=A0ABD5PD89_9EURY|nr:GNAT family N-acetyltransferase [Halobium salinum]